MGKAFQHNIAASNAGVQGMSAAVQFVATDPGAQQILANHRGSFKNPTADLNAYLQSKGVPPLMEGWSWSHTGEPVQPATTGVDAFLQYGLPALVGFTGGSLAASGAAGAGAAGASSGAGAGSAGAGTAGAAGGGTLASTGAGAGAAGAGTGAAAGTGAGVGTGAAAAGAGIGLKQLLPSIISAGGGVAGTLIGAHANTEAANAQAAATEKALALQREIYQQQRADLAPYRTMGSNAVGRLSDLWGFPQDPSMVRTAQSVPVSQADPVHGSDIYIPNMNKNPANGPVGNTGPTPAGMITVKAPDGSVRALSPADANRALALGATYA